MKEAGRIGILNLLERQREWRFKPIDSVLYGLLTFGSLIFIIAGLYITQISKLKFGAIELEKTSGQPVNIPSALNISSK